MKRILNSRALLVSLVPCVILFVSCSPKDDSAPLASASQHMKPSSVEEAVPPPPALTVDHRFDTEFFGDSGELRAVLKELVAHGCAGMWRQVDKNGNVSLGGRPSGKPEEGFDIIAFLKEAQERSGAGHKLVDFTIETYAARHGSPTSTSQDLLLLEGGSKPIIWNQYDGVWLGVAPEGSDRVIVVRWHAVEQP